MVDRAWWIVRASCVSFVLKPSGSILRKRRDPPVPCHPPRSSNNRRARIRVGCTGRVGFVPIDGRVVQGRVPFLCATGHHEVLLQCTGALEAVKVKGHELPHFQSGREFLAAMIDQALEVFPRCIGHASQWGRFLRRLSHHLICDLPEQPGPAQASSSHHDAAGSGFVHHLHCVHRFFHVPVSDDGDGERVDHFGDGFPVHGRAVELIRRPRVQGHARRAGVLCGHSGGHVRQRFQGESHPQLDRHRHSTRAIHCGSHQGMQQLRLERDGRTASFTRDFSHGTSEVEVDVCGSDLFHQHSGGVFQGVSLRAVQLHGSHALLSIEGHEFHGFRRAFQQGVRRNHLADRRRGPLSDAHLSKRRAADACHGCRHQRRFHSHGILSRSEHERLRLRRPCRRRHRRVLDRSRSHPSGFEPCTSREDVVVWGRARTRSSSANVPAPPIPKRRGPARSAPRLVGSRRGWPPRPTSTHRPSCVRSSVLLASVASSPVEAPHPGPRPRPTGGILPRSREDGTPGKDEDKRGEEDRIDRVGFPLLFPKC
eukprot:scaffold126_cov315-Pavlova_lutheri.AAC.41